MKKLFILLGVLLLLAQGLAAQQCTNPELVSQLKIAPFVFEGVIMYTERYTEKAPFQWIQSYVKVTRVFRGDTSWVGKTIEVVSPWDTNSYYPDGERHSRTDNRNKKEISDEYHMMFFTEKLNKSIPLSPNYTPDIKLRTYKLKHGMYQVKGVLPNQGYDVRASMLADFKKIAPDLLIDPKEYQVLKSATVDTFNYQREKARFDRYFTGLQKRCKKDNKLKNLKSGSQHYLKIELIPSGSGKENNGKEFYQLDVYISSDIPRYLENCLFDLRYDVGSDFYENSIANNKLRIVMDTAFSAPSYDAPYAVDFSPNTIRVGVGSNFSKPNRTLVSRDSRRLMSIKFDLIPEITLVSKKKSLSTGTINFNVVNFGSYFGLNFNLYTRHPRDNISSTNPMSSSLEETSPTQNYFYYDLSSAINIETSSKPSIKYFMDVKGNRIDSITAGTNSILTIIGTGFGDGRKNSPLNRYLSFVNANVQSGYFILDDYDYQIKDTTSRIPSMHIPGECWTDTLIKVKVPSTTNKDTKYCAGSGILQINGSDTKGKKPIIVKASYMNKIGDNGGKYPIYLTNSYLEGGVAMGLDPSYPFTSAQKKVLKAAFDAWSSRMGGPIVSLDTIGTGYKNIVEVLPSLPNAEDLAQGGGLTTISTLGNDTVYYYKPFIFQISQLQLDSVDYALPGTALSPFRYDFLKVSEHEIGHMLGLGHVVGEGKMMWMGSKKSSSFGTAANTRLSIANDPKTVTNARYIIDKSKTIKWPITLIHTLTNYGESSPLAPSNGSLQNDKNSKTQTLKWQNNSKSQTGIKIERASLSSHKLDTITIANPTTTSYTYTNLASGVYCYRIWTFNSYGNSDQINLDCATMAYAPSQPKWYIMPSYQNNQVSFGWNNINWTDTIVVERALYPGYDFIRLAVLNSSAVSYSDAAIQTGQNYYYKIRAKNSSGDSVSNTASVLTSLPVNDMYAPNNLTANTISNGVISLNWSDNSNNENGFTIERSSSATAGFATIGSVSAGRTSFIDVNAGMTQPFYYRITAFNTKGTSSYSSLVTAKGCANYLTDSTSIYSALRSGFNNTQSPFTARKIYIQSSIESGAIVNLYASKNIIFQPGFLAVAGSEIKAYIVDECKSSIKSEEVLSNTPLDLLKENLIIYPNPATETLFIQYLQEQNTLHSIYIFSMTGELVYQSESFKTESGKWQIQLNQFSNGIYILKSVTDGQVLTKKICIQLR